MRRAWIIAAIVIVVAVIVRLVFAMFSRTLYSAPTVTTPSPIPAGPAKAVVLFFADPAGNGLVARRADVAPSGDTAAVASEALAALAAGPSSLPAGDTTQPPVIAPLPAGVTVGALFFDGKGTATVDLQHLADKLAGAGTDADVLALWSVVDTLAFNFPADARRVRVLLDGHEADAAGEIAIDSPLAPRRDLVVGDVPVVGAPPVAQGDDATPP